VAALGRPGNAGGLLLSGIFVSSVVSRLRFSGARQRGANILEDLGLVTFVGIVGINAGASLLANSPGGGLQDLRRRFIACTIPPFVTWALGFHLFKINRRADGRRRGARSHSGPAGRLPRRSAPRSRGWVPCRLCVSGVLLTVLAILP